MEVEVGICVGYSNNYSIADPTDVEDAKSVTYLHQ